MTRVMESETAGEGMKDMQQMKGPERGK